MPERQRVKEERASRVQLRRGCPVAESTQERHIQLEASHGNSEIDRVSPAPEMVTGLLRSMKIVSHGRAKEIIREMYPGEQKKQNKT